MLDPVEDTEMERHPLPVSVADVDAVLLDIPDVLDVTDGVSVAELDGVAVPDAEKEFVAVDDGVAEFVVDIE